MHGICVGMLAFGPRTDDILIDVVDDDGNVDGVAFIVDVVIVVDNDISNELLQLPLVSNTVD